MGKIIDNYILEEVIGNGSFGKVFRGYHKDNKVQIAAKCMKKSKMKNEFYELLKIET